MVPCILERAKKLVFKAKFCRYIKIFQKILTLKTGFLSVPKLVRFTPVRHATVGSNQQALGAKSAAILIVYSLSYHSKTAS